MTHRVLWLTKGLGRGGAEILLLGLASAMHRPDISLDVGYTLGHKSALVGQLQAAGVRVHKLGEGAAPWPVQLRHLLAHGDYDIVHSHAPLVGSAARLLAPRNAVLLHTEHNMWQRYHPATRLANAVTIGRNELVWAVSDQVGESIRPPAVMRRPVVEVMLHGVDLTAVRSGSLAREEALDRLRIHDGGFVFGTVGNLTPKKDQGTLLEAFARVRSQIPGCWLVVVGTGPREVELRTLSRQLGIEQAVRFLGMREDVEDLLPGFDTFVLSSLHEGLSIALIEALAAGVPVVATRVGGIPQLIAHGENGLLVPARDVSRLARTMAGLVSDEAERKRLAAAGPVRAADFSIQSAADALAAHYRRFARSTASKAVVG